MRGLIIAALLSVAAPVAAETDAQKTLAQFLAAADGKDVRKVDRAIAECITEHASAGQTRKLVKLAAADNKDKFVKVMKRTAAGDRELESCLEGAALTAMMGF